MTMKQAGMDPRTVKVRIITGDAHAEDAASVLVEALELLGCEVMEWSRPKPRRDPEEGLSTVYLTGRLMGEKPGRPDFS